MHDYTTWAGKTVFDKDDTKVGSVADLYYDEDSKTPSWTTVKSGIFGNKVHFAPLQGAHEIEDGIRLAVSEEQIKTAPSVNVDEELSDEDENLLFQHYSGRSHETSEGHDTSGPNTDEAMTRSEERLNINKKKQEVSRIRLKKYIVTEDVHVTVPVEREVFRLEREPITDDNRDQALDGPELSEEEHEIILSKEVLDIQKKTVPVERIKLRKDIVTEEENVNETVRKERIDAEGHGESTT